MSDMVRIWSFEHNAWWAPDSKGYTQIESKAGLYSRAYAEHIVTNANYRGRKNEEIRELPARREQCPTCGHAVSSIFDHIAIDCEHDMSREEIHALLAGEDNG